MADKQTASSKLEQKNAAMDKAQEEGYKRYQAQQKQEAEDNAAPRKAAAEAVGKAVDYVKGKASDFGKATGLYAKGGKVKSASARADGCAIRGKTRA
jgi:hypothetical protein